MAPNQDIIVAVMGSSLKSTARGLAVSALCEYSPMDQRRPSEIIDHSARGVALADRDRRLLSNIFFGVIRNRRLLDHLIDRRLKKPHRLPDVIRNVLRAAAFQVLFCDRIPDRAAIHTAVDLARLHGGQSMASLANAVLRRIQEEGPAVMRKELSHATAESLGIRYSFPDWMVKRWLATFGPEETRALLEAMNSHPPLNLRVNTLLSDREACARRLGEEGVENRHGKYSPVSLTAEPGTPLQNTDAYADGLFSIQDEAFQLIGSLLPLKGARMVLDCFAGLGGKSTHLAQRSVGESLVVALEIDAGKLSKLRGECERLSIDTIAPLTADASCPPLGEETFDAVLLDVPCSGTGVIRRHPDIKWNRSEDDPGRLSLLQYRFLEAAAGLIKKGGHLLYATCSMEPEENEGVVMHFLGNYDKFRLLDLKKSDLEPELVSPSGLFKSFPHRHGIDGSGAALLQRI